MTASVGQAEFIVFCFLESYVYGMEVHKLEVYE